MKLVLVFAVCTLSAFGDVDFTVDAGVIRPLNGLCNLAAPQNPGMRLLDVSRVFPLFHLDPDDPRNYDFRVADRLRPLMSLAETSGE